MQTHAAVFRTGPVMKEGIEKMNALWKDMANIKLSDRGMIWNRLVKTLQNKICFVTMALNSVNWDVKGDKILTLCRYILGINCLSIWERIIAL